MSAVVAALGVHIAAGTAWFAPTSALCELVPDAVDRLELKENELDLPRALSELELSIEHLLGRQTPGVVVLLRPGTGYSPSPSDSRRRGWIEGALLTACHRSGTEFVDVTHDRLKKQFGIKPTNKAFAAGLADRLDGKPPVKWGDRALAFAAALTTLEETA